MENLKLKGFDDVIYPRAPWYNDRVEEIKKEADEMEKRIAGSEHAHLLAKLPADRSPGVSKDRVRIEKSDLHHHFKLPI